MATCHLGDQGTNVSGTMLTPGLLLSVSRGRRSATCPQSGMLARESEHLCGEGWRFCWLAACPAGFPHPRVYQPASPLTRRQAKHCVAHRAKGSRDKRRQVGRVPACVELTVWGRSSVRSRVLRKPQSPLTGWQWYSPHCDSYLCSDIAVCPSGKAESSPTEGIKVSSHK